MRDNKWHIFLSSAKCDTRFFTLIEFHCNWTLVPAFVNFPGSDHVMVKITKRMHNPQKRFSFRFSAVVFNPFRFLIGFAFFAMLRKAADTFLCSHESHRERRKEKSLNGQFILCCHLCVHASRRTGQRRRRKAETSNFYAAAI